MADPLTGEVKKRCIRSIRTPAACLTTGGGLVFTAYTDGTMAAYDDTTLDQVWKINMGVGFNAPPIAFEAGGKQYVAILSGISRITKGGTFSRRATRAAQPDHAVRVRAVRPAW